MKVIRQKKARKILNFFKMNYGLKPPFKIIGIPHNVHLTFFCCCCSCCCTLNRLVDPSFLAKCIEHKIFLKEQLPQLFGDKAFPGLSFFFSVFYLIILFLCNQ